MPDLTDARGQSITNFRKKPVRIVSLVPSQTELLYHLGLDAEVVGITKFCVHPKAWYQTKTRVGGTKTLHLEVIKRLEPDLVLANKEENTQDQVAELANHFPVWTTAVGTFADALNMIETVGILTGKTAEATFLKAHISRAFSQLFLQNQAKKPRTCYLIWNDPLMTVGGDTFIHDMLLHAGFENIAASEKRYPLITIGALQQANCELLLLSSEPYPFSEKHIAHLQPLLPHTKMQLVDGEMFSWYGSRLQWAPAYFKKLQIQLKTNQ